MILAHDDVDAFKEIEQIATVEHSKHCAIAFKAFNRAGALSGWCAESGWTSF